MRALVVSAVAAFAVSVLINPGSARQQVVTGTVAKFQSREFLSVVNETTDPAGLPIGLRNATVYEGRGQNLTHAFESIAPGSLVAVWYRHVGERRPVADRVRLLAPAKY